MKNLVFFLGLTLLPFVSYGGNVFSGKELYLNECSACHGSDGRGEMAGIASFSESNVLFKADRELISVISHGKGIMPAYKGLLTNDEIRDVVAYLRTFM